LIMIRHAQSEQNAHMESVMEKVTRGELSLAGFNKVMRDGPPGTGAGDDAKLTDLGLSQAAKLGAMWAPLLAEKAKHGKLICCVSPFCRTLQTADPLMTELRKRVPGFQAILLPPIMEAGGLTAGEDFKKFDDIEALMKQGKRTEAIAFLKNIKWKPQGMTGKQILKRFDWVRKATAADTVFGADIDVNVADDTPWYTDGYESRKRAETRVRKVATWIRDEVSTNASGTTGDGVVVVMVTHGQTIAQSTNFLVHAALTGKAEENESVSFDGIRNTSVTGFLLPSPDYMYPGDRPNTANELVRYACKLEFFNDTAHLGDEQHRFHANFVLGAGRPEAPVSPAAGARL
jgi:broad specificity phosphatase PhoE